MEDRINEALQIAFDWSGFDGGHHKQWVIDQMVRVLTGDEYKKWVADYETPTEDGDKFEWDTGVAP